MLSRSKVVDDVHKDAREAKKRGELVGWSSSKFPCELAAAFDLNVMYPENQAAGIAANRYGELMCQAAEDLGYDNDICGYARISLAYAAGVRVARKFDPETGEYIIDPSTGKPLKDADGNIVIDEATGKPKKDPKTQTPYLELVNLLELEKLPDGPDKERRIAAISPIRQMQIPQPDFVLCCNNICNCMTKWYENIARMCNVPLIMIDIPYNNTVEVADQNVRYVRGQFDKAIKQLEELTGKKFDEKKFEHACENANRTAKAWLKVCDYLQYKPAPYSGFDLFNHMADVVTARARVEAAAAFEQLAKDLDETIAKGETTTPFPEKYRVMFEGIPCWPKLPALFKPLHRVQRKLGTGQFIGSFLIVGLHRRDVIVGVGVVDDAGLAAVLLLHTLLGQSAFHLQQLAFPLGELRNVDQQLVDGHVKAVHGLRGIKNVDGVLELADFRFQLCETDLRFSVIVGGPDGLDILPHGSPEVPAAGLLVQQRGILVIQFFQQLVGLCGGVVHFHLPLFPLSACIEFFNSITRSGALV